MLVQDPTTGQWVDDGTPVNTPGSTPLFEPDEVKPGDLQTAPYPLTIEGGLEAARRFGGDPGTKLLGATGGALLSGLGGGPHEQLARQMGQQDAVAADAVAPGAPAEMPQPAPQPAAMPRPARGGGGGGGGGSALPLGPNVGQTLAHGAQLTADEEERNVVSDKTSLEQRKSAAEVEQDAAEATAHAALLKQQAAERAAYQAKLQATEDTYAKDKIHDQFDGHPLKAILAALSSGLGAFAATMSGGVNHAQGILDRSADMFRQKELHRFEQEKDAITGARMSQEHAEVRADAAEAGFWRQAQRDRTAILRARFGNDEARITGDALNQQINAKIADKRANWEDKSAAIFNQGLNDRAQRAAQYASAGHANAEAAKTRAETDVIRAGGGPGGAEKGSGRAASIQIGKATLAAQLDDDFKAYDSTPGLSPAGQKLLQRNATGLKGASEEHGLGGAAKVGLGRAVGYVPKSLWEGLSPSDKKAAQAAMAISQKVSALVATSHSESEMNHLRPLFDITAPGADVNQMLDMARNQKAVAGAMGGKYTQRAEAAVQARQAAAPPPAARPTPAEIARVNAARQAARPGSPDWVKWTQVAKNMQAAMGQ